MNKKIVIYLGMALSGTPLWWHKYFYRLVVEELEKIPNVKVSRFVGLDGHTESKDVYDFDIGLASNADVMVVLTRFSSIGLGMEVQARVNLGKSTLLAQPTNRYLSKMPRGANHTTLVPYRPGWLWWHGRASARDIASQVQKQLQQAA